MAGGVCRGGSIQRCRRSSRNGDDVRLSGLHVLESAPLGSMIYKQHTQASVGLLRASLCMCEGVTSCYRCAHFQNVQTAVIDYTLMPPLPLLDDVASQHKPCQTGTRLFLSSRPLQCVVAVSRAAALERAIGVDRRRMLPPRSPQSLCSQASAMSAHAWDSIYGKLELIGQWKRRAGVAPAEDLSSVSSVQSHCRLIGRRLLLSFGALLLVDSAWPQLCA